MEKYDITAIGEILIDYTSLNKSENGMEIYEQNAGGAPANVLAAAAKFGAKTAFIGKVGEDLQGKFLKSTLEKANIDTKGMIIDKKYFTTLAFVSLSESGERSFSFARKHSADINLSKSELNIEIIKNTSILHFGSLSLTHECCREATIEAIKIAKENGALISYDPNNRPLLWESYETAKERIRSMIPYVDIIKLSEEEMELLTDQKDHKLVANTLLSHGIKVVILTMGSEGVLVSTKDGSKKVDGFKVEKVVDTTGAGDSFLGAILYQIIKKHKNLEDISLEEWREYALIANATAAICIGRRGAINAMPTIEEVNHLIL